MTSTTTYDEIENIISSDEYSDQDGRFIDIPTSIEIISKEKENYNMSAFSKKNNVAARVKKRSINWLNKKNVRQNYKTVLLRILKGNNEKKPNNSIINSTLSSQLIHISTESENQKPSDIQTVDSKLSTSNLFPKLEKKIHIINEDFSIRNIELNNQKMSLPKCKRSRSLSPTLLQLNDDQFPIDPNINHNTLLCREVNKLFPQYNKILKDYVKCSIGTTEKIEQKISQTLLEIQTLSDMIKSKEHEWNKLLHLRKVKEEVLLHLTRKKNLKELKERHIKTHDYKNFDFIESSECSFENRNNLQYRKNASSVAQTLVESRANMRKEDLEMEKLNINRLHSILVSGNILHNSQSTAMNANKMADNICEPKFSIQQFKINEAFGSENTGKDSITTLTNFHEKKGESKELDRRHGSFGLLNKCKTNSHNSFSLHDVLLKTTSNFVPDDGKLDIIENEVPLCQACKANEARFVCAGCGNQWYCSRQCQVTAWDKHSYICKE